MKYNSVIYDVICPYMMLYVHDDLSGYDVMCVYDVIYDVMCI